MAEFIYNFTRGVGNFYIIYLLLYATFLFSSVLVGAFQLYKRDRMTRFRNELKHEYYIPVSILVPAHNEEVTVVDNVRSLIGLNYRLYEIIIIDDGSDDETAKRLIEAFDFKLCTRPIRRVLECAPLKALYETKTENINMTLVVKENGGKGDALNMGINASNYPYYLCIDADSMLQKDSLEKIAQPVLEDDKVVAVGGLIRVLQCAKFSDAGSVEYHLPHNPIVCMQVMEYDRSFLANRILLDSFNGNLIISGAFGLFKKAAVIAAGGYNHETLGEDMDLVVKLHVYHRNNAIDYSIRYEPNAICWSQAPTGLIDLAKQRRRWNLGLLQSMVTYRQIFANPRFGLLSYISYMYYFLYELVSPFVEVFGILAIVVAGLFGLLNPVFMLRFFLLYTAFGAVLSITAFYQRIYTQNLRITALDMLRAMVMCVMEIGFFRYILAFVRLTSFFTYKKRKSIWGEIKRVKYGGEDYV